MRTTTYDELVSLAKSLGWTAKDDGYAKGARAFERIDDARVNIRTISGTLNVTVAGAGERYVKCERQSDWPDP